MRLRNCEQAFLICADSSSLNFCLMQVMKDSLVLWNKRLVMFSTTQNSPTDSNLAMREANRRTVQTQKCCGSANLEPGWLCRPEPSPAATSTACHQQHTLSTDTSRPVGPSVLGTTPKSRTVAGNFVFMTLGTSLVFTESQQLLWELWIWS
uniref:Uncharacterized protein n=1 Tax=Lepeophtheirus salmonis TaxID=72036 RepID=A0A0K2V3G3_LEPSM